MARRRKVRDNELIDAIEAAPETEFEAVVWRVVRGDRDPLLGSSPGGRWDDATFDVLYTSAESDGALAEMYFHLTRGQPIVPSRMEFRRYEIRVALSRALRLESTAELEALGVEEAGYGSLKYGRAQEEYLRTQEIAEVAFFLEYDGLIVPSARWQCRNVILYTDRVPPEAMTIVRDHGVVDWADWKARQTKN